MKHLLFALFTLLTVAATAQDVKQNQILNDSLSQWEKEFGIILAEQFIVDEIDSIISEGMYMQALERLDSLQVKWSSISGRGPTLMMNILRGQIYMGMEEWQQLIYTTIECINNNKGELTDKAAALVYNMQGTAYKNLEDYANAIRSYENAFSHYSKINDQGSQGEMLCNIAYSYDKKGKPSTASSFYQRGFSKFLQYFNISKKQLLRSDLKVDDTYRKKVMNVFGCHLFNMAVFEQDNGDKSASKEFLIMSAHCGNTIAKKEYQRIYGRY